MISQIEETSHFSEVHSSRIIHLPSESCTRCWDADLPSWRSVWPEQRLCICELKWRSTLVGEGLVEELYPNSQNHSDSEASTSEVKLCNPSESFCLNAGLRIFVLISFDGVQHGRFWTNFCTPPLQRGLFHACTSPFCRDLLLRWLDSIFEGLFRMGTRDDFHFNFPPVQNQLIRDVLMDIQGNAPNNYIDAEGWWVNFRGCL